MVERSRRQEALKLAEELLGDIELGRVPTMDLARKTSRLARLLDDAEAMVWLQYEITGYSIDPSTNLDPPAWAAAKRSNRLGYLNGKQVAYTAPLGQIEALIEAALAQIAAAADPSVSISSANPQQFVVAPLGNANERALLRNFVGDQRALLDKVVGSFHAYVSVCFQELRFGNAIESAFEIVRREVDSTIGKLVPNALPKLSAALENASSDNPEHWSNAASTCRRLVKAVADALRPPGPDIDGHKMGDDNYVNRLVNWIVSQAESDTATAMIQADLKYLGQRLDAAADAGHKGAHAEVDRFDASRFITGTYLLLGDILRLHRPTAVELTETGPAETRTELAPLDVEAPAAEPEGSAP